MQLIALLLFGALIWWLVMGVVHIFMHIWPLLVAALALWCACKFAMGWAELEAARRDKEASRRQHLVRRADEQHRQVLKGDLDGVYGAFPPPQETRGMGIWLLRKLEP